MPLFELNKAQREIIKAMEPILPRPLVAKHVELSLLLSSDDDNGFPDDFLLDLLEKAAKEARTISLRDMIQQIPNAFPWMDQWPGEHYRLLAGLIKCLKPGKVVEIGTQTGLSALVMKKFMDPGSVLVTYDLYRWQQFKETSLNEDDFQDGTLIQRIGDLKDGQLLVENKADFENAELIFIDAAKDQEFEAAFVKNLELISFKKPPILVFDDIRMIDMLACWRNINRPKIDATTYGHWSGTGIVHWIIKKVDSRQ